MKPSDARALRRRVRSGLALVLVATLTACGGTASPDAGEAAGETLRNCDVDVPADAPPERVFAAYQPAIEMAHALGIGDRLVGTAFLDAVVLDDYVEAQAEQKYYPNLPSREELLDARPDFVLSGFTDVFTDESLGTRASLRELGVESWIFSPLCPSEDGRSDESIDPADVTMDNVYADLRDLGTLFDVSERADEVIAEMRATVDGVTETLEGRVDEDERPTVMIGRPGDQGFHVAGGPDFSTELIDLAGGVNAFADLDGRRNHQVSVEDVIERDPDYILIDVCCDAEMTAADSAPDIERIMDNPALANLTAVSEDQVREFTFADRSAGVRSAPAVATIAEIIHPDLFG
ncbi:ABC transporter substrate-binding protein [Nocardiopsis alba]|uniref:ABC transporter substrate-binding protein n=1 Tax=Nocardiopsis alba TaxID=53437 RepID=UPI003D706AAC